MQPEIILQCLEELACQFMSIKTIGLIEWIVVEHSMFDYYVS